MTLARDIIAAAFRKIGVVSEDEDMTADQAASGLFALNTMMHGWKAFGVDVEHTDYTLDSTFALAPQFVEGTIYQLAQKLSPAYAVAGVDGDVFFRALQAAYLVIDEATVPYALLNTPMQRRKYWGGGY